MPDITMCNGQRCPVREKCYRFTAKADELWQSYFVESPIKDNKCDHYWGENAQSIFEQLGDILKKAE